MQGFPPQFPPQLQQMNVNVITGAILLYPDLSANPTGQITIEPWGWMICDGRILNINSYPELYATIGTLYNKPGDVNGSFRLPDLGVQQINDLPFRYIIKYTHSITR